MNEKRHRLGIYLPTLIFAILACVTLRTVACLTELNFKTGYFDGKVLITVAGYLALAFSVLFLSYAPLAPKNEKLIASFSTPATYIPSGAVCVALIFFAINLINGQPSGTLGNYMPAFVKIIGILSLLMIIHLILTAFITEAPSVLRAGFGLCAVLALAFYSAYLYFSSKLPLNAPNKIVDQMAFIFSSVFFLYETRISLKRERWNLYISFGLIAALLTAYSSIPSLIVYLTKGAVISDSIYETAFCFALFLFIAARLALASSIPNDEESEFIKNLKASSDKKAEELEIKIQEKNASFLEIINSEIINNVNTENDFEESEAVIESEIFTPYEESTPISSEDSGDETI